jgi:hypothetical protein
LTFVSNPERVPECSRHELQPHRFPEEPVDVLSFLGGSCSFKPLFRVPFMPSGFARRLVPNVRPFRVLGTALSLPCPWRQCSLCRSGMARRVKHPRAATNFF